MYNFWNENVDTYVKPQLEVERAKNQTETKKCVDSDAEKAIESAKQWDKSKIGDTEFVSDTFQTCDKDLEEVQAGMKMLGIDTLVTQARSNGKDHSDILLKNNTKNS